jgi:hypothetical protein
MLDIDLLDDDVLEDICDNLEIDSGDEEAMKRVQRLSPEEAFERFLTWNGIIGYGDMIASALDNIRLASGEDCPLPDDEVKND